jgi:hypothetical protein
MEAIAEALELPLPCLLIPFEPSEEHPEPDNLPPENEYVPKRKANIIKKWDRGKKGN